MEPPGPSPGPPATPPTGPSLGVRPESRRSRDRLTVAVASALGLGLLLGGGGWAVATRGPSCEGSALLEVTADPGVAPAVTAVAATLDRQRRRSGRCPSVRVTVGKPEETAAAFRDGKARVDVWIPDSSLWLDMLPRAIRPAAGQAASVASSPLVFALSARDAGRHGEELDQRAWAAFGPGVSHHVYRASTAPPARYLLRVPDPSSTGAGMLSLLALDASVRRSTTKGVSDRFAATMRTVRPLQEGEDLDAAFTAQSGPTQVAIVPEQMVLQHDAGRDAGHDAKRPVQRLEAVYSGGGAPYLDFPYHVVSRDTADRQTATALLAALRTPSAMSELRRVGLRSAQRTPPAADAGDAQTVSAAWARTPALAPRALNLSRPGAAARARENWRRISQGLNLLAVIDQAGVRRSRGAALADMKTALGTGLALVPADTAFGLWEFTGWSRGKAYRTAAPLMPLSERTSAGTPHSYAFKTALEGLRPRKVPHRGRGLNATVRAAYHHMTRHYDDGLNVILVFTARGARSPVEPDQIATVKALSREFRADQPVSVVVVGFGDGLPRGLSGLATATDGGAYHVSSPGRVVDLFKRSDGLRICDDPRCAD